MDNFRVLRMADLVSGRFTQLYKSDTLSDCVKYVQMLPTEEYDYTYIVEDVGLPISSDGSLNIKSRGTTWFNANYNGSSK